MQQSVDVIVLTFKPQKQVFRLIEALEKQTCPIQKLIIMNTEEKYFNALFYGTGFLEKYKNIEVHHVSQREFDHARTRTKGAGYSDADILVFMTQDALPADETLIETLVAALAQDEKVAAAYARQLPYPDCRETERFTRDFNYPAESVLKSYADIDKMGIKTFMCSNVCAAYDRATFDALGGFVKKAVFNEDMLYAAKAVKAGFRIAYAAEARVFHSHNYTCMQQFRRNFDLGVSQAEHPEVFAEVSSESEGGRLVRDTAKHLRKTGNTGQIPYLIVSSACKYMGYLLGTHYKRLPYGIIKWCSSSKGYWA